MTRTTKTAAEKAAEKKAADAAALQGKADDAQSAADQAAAQSSEQADAQRKATDAEGEALSNPADLIKPPKNAAPSAGLKPEKSSFVEPSGPEVESVRVLIVKDETTTVPKRVFAHEVALLQEIWGEDKVTVVDGTELAMPLNGDVHEEYRRLQRIYGRKGAAALAATYPTVQILADEAGVKLVRERVGSKAGRKSAPQSAQRGGGVQ